MYSILILGSAVAITVCTGIYLIFRSRKHSIDAVKAKCILLGAMAFLFSMLCLSTIPVFAAETAEGASNASSAAGLGFLGASIATGLACVGAGVAVGYVGAAALGVVGEKPAMLGTTLIYLGLAEGIAIYGIIVSLLILGRL